MKDDFSKSIICFSFKTKTIQDNDNSSLSKIENTSYEYQAKLLYNCFGATIKCANFRKLLKTCVR